MFRRDPVRPGKDPGRRQLHQGQVLHKHLKLWGILHRHQNHRVPSSHMVEQVFLIYVMERRRKIYIVLEYVGGGELFDKIARQGNLKKAYVGGTFNNSSMLGLLPPSSVYHKDLKEDGLLHTACGTPIM